jgi:hypothetical protein
MSVEVYGEVEYTRGRDFFDPLENEHAHVTIVGCGGIGSFAAHALAKLGVPKLTLVDFDVVEAHNVPNQLFTMEHVGAKKSHALAEILSATTHAEVNAWDGAVNDTGWWDTENDQPWGFEPQGVVVAALDSMEARMNLWSQMRLRWSVPLFIDGRLGGQNVVVYAADPRSLDDIRGYEATLHSDGEGLDFACTARAIIDVPYAMASIITRHVRRHFAGEDVENVVFQDQSTLSLTTSEWLL